MPGDCSPSRSVVSKMITRSAISEGPFIGVGGKTKPPGPEAQEAGRAPGGGSPSGKEEAGQRLGAQHVRCHSRSRTYPRQGVREYGLAHGEAVIPRRAVAGSARWGWLGRCVVRCCSGRAAESVDVSPDPWTPVLPFPDPPAAEPAPVTRRPSHRSPSPRHRRRLHPPHRSPPRPRPRSRSGPRPSRPGSGPHPWTATARRVTRSRPSCPAASYRVPGMAGYDRTRPDRCYRSEEDAIADGFTRAKR